MELNIFHIGSPGGIIKIYFGKILVKNNILKQIKINVNIHIAGFVLLKDDVLYDKLKKSNFKIIGYQHGGGYGMNTINYNKELLKVDEYILWNYKNKLSIHRWGYSSKIKLLINSFFKKGKVKLVLPTLNTKFNESEKFMIIQQNFSKKLVKSNFKTIPKNWNICWDPRDKKNTIPLEQKSSKNDVFVFIGFPSTFIWYCIKFDIKFYVIDDGSFDYVESINYNEFSNEAINFIKYVKTKILNKNEQNLYYI